MIICSGSYFGFCEVSNHHRYLASHKYSQTVASGSDKMETERTELDGLLENVGNMLLEDILIVDVQMDASEAAATLKEEEIFFKISSYRPAGVS